MNHPHGFQEGTLCVTLDMFKVIHAKVSKSYQIYKEVHALKFLKFGHSMSDLHTIYESQGFSAI